MVHADGHELVTVASRFGALSLSRQVCSHPRTQTHVIPSNAVLPPHHGIIITRGLQEWACLLPQELPFGSVARLLGWQTHDTCGGYLPHPLVLGPLAIHQLSP